MTDKAVDLQNWDEQSVLTAGNGVRDELRREGDTRYGAMKQNDGDAATPQDKGRTPDDPQKYQRGIGDGYLQTGGKGS